MADPCPGTRTTATSLKAVMTCSLNTPSMASLGSIVNCLLSMADSAPGRPGTSTSARNPSLPRFTPRTGASCRSASRMARSIVPSPPRLTTRSQRRPSSSAVTGTAAQFSLLISVSMPKTAICLRAAQPSTASTASAESRWGCRTRPTECIPRTLPSPMTPRSTEPPQPPRQFGRRASSAALGASRSDADGFLVQTVEDVQAPFGLDAGGGHPLRVAAHEHVGEVRAVVDELARSGFVEWAGGGLEGRLMEVGEGVSLPVGQAHLVRGGKQDSPRDELHDVAGENGEYVGDRGDERPGFVVFVSSGHRFTGEPVTSAFFTGNGRADVQSAHVVLRGDDEQAVVGVGADAAFRGGVGWREPQDAHMVPAVFGQSREVLHVGQPEAQGCQLQQAVADISDDAHVVLHGGLVAGGRPGDWTVAWPLPGDAGVVPGDVRADGENLRTVFLARRLFLAGGDVPAVGEVGDVCGLLAERPAEESAGGVECVFGGGLLRGGGLDLEDAVGFPGSDERQAEGLVGIAALDYEGQLEGLECCHVSVLAG